MIPKKLFLATVREVPDVLVFPDGSGNWYSATSVTVPARHHLSTDVTDVRPAVVLDLEAVTSHLAGDLDHRVRSVCRWLKYGDAEMAVHRIADAIEAQYQPQPTVPQAIRRQLAGVVLTEAERKLLAAHADSLENGGDHDRA